MYFLLKEMHKIPITIGIEVQFVILGNLYLKWYLPSFKQLWYRINALSTAV